MNKIMGFFVAVVLCILAVPAMASDEPTDPNTLFGGDNIWISISPMESHPMYVDRPAAVIPTIPGYPIRVAVYSNPYRYLTTDEDGNPIWAEIYDPNTENFSVSSLDGIPKENITLRLPDTDDPTVPAASGAAYSKVHTENDYKYEYVFYVRDMEGLNEDINRLFFVAEGSDKTYQGSGLVSVTQTSGGGGSKGGKGR